MDNLEDQPDQSGGCLCGKVRYELKGPRYYGVLCHCVTCRRVTGGSFLAASIYPIDGFKVTKGDEEVKSFESVETDSGKPLFRCFCGNCGANLWAKTPLNDSIISICAGTQDRIADWKPSKEQYCRNKHDWLAPVSVDGMEIATHATHPMLERR